MPADDPPDGRPPSPREPGSPRPEGDPEPDERGEVEGAETPAGADRWTGPSARAEHPVWSRPPAGEGASEPPPPGEGSPPDEPPSVRGRHLAWARLDAAADEAPTARFPAAHAEPSPPADTRPIAPPSPPDAGPSPVPSEATPSQPPARTEPPRPADAQPPPTPAGGRSPTWSGPSEETGTPSAIGRLVAIVVTCGLAWALAVAVGVWLLVFLASRSG